MKLKTIKRNLKYFIPLLLKISPMSIIIMVLVALFNSISNVAWVVFPKLILDELFYTKNYDKLLIIVIAFIATQLICRILDNIFSSVNYYIIQKADFKIDKLFNEKIAHIDYFHIEDPEFNDELSYAKNCLSEYSNGIYSITWTIKSFIENILTILSVISIIILGGEFLVILVTLIGVILNTIFYGKYQKIDEEFNSGSVRYSRKQWYYGKSIMAFRSQKNLRMYEAEELIKSKSDDANKEIFKIEEDANSKRNKVSLFEYSFNYLFTTFITIIILAFAVYYKNLELTVFTLLYGAVQTLDNGIANLIYSSKKYYQDCIYQENFINLMEIETIFRDGKKSIEKIETIEFKNVSFKYPRCDEYVLKNLSFKIDSRQKVSLVGLNGSGKTTIIKLICRFFDVNEGEILINGENIKLYKYEDYMKCLAIVFQDFKIISFSVKNNIAILDENKEKLYDVLERSEALERIKELPDKENTYINKWFDKKGVEFSGGELQKFALARALYKDADFVVLDEPTSALDPVSESKIYYHFKDVVGEKLTLFISHRLSSCIFSDKILVLDGYNIVEIGTHEELMKNKEGLYRKMFMAQAEYYN